MALSLPRQTLYALISSIEEDLRLFIVSSFAGQVAPKSLLSEPVWGKAVERMQREQGPSDGSPQLEQLLPYTDYQELIDAINSHRALLTPQVAQYFKDLAPSLAQIAPVRNRVMHSRPLEFDDLALVTQTAERMVSSSPLPWTTLKQMMGRLRANPASVLGIELVVEETRDAVMNNLPEPDFDETGFIGRREIVGRLIKACVSGPYPVITIVGEGGVGKTALALKVAYELLEQPDLPFQAIVWTSSKTALLTPHEIQSIGTAISDSLGLLQAVATELGASQSSDPLDEVLEYLRTFRVLLVLDNLETVLDARIRAFLGQLPAGSKILITSRIGIGAYEDRITLNSLESGEAVQLLRAVARARQMQELVSFPNSVLATYCFRMRNNPLWIKWFVSAVQSGKRPEEVLAHSDVFLQYCMSNVYEHLTPKSQQLLRAAVAVPGLFTMAELAYISNLSGLAIQEAIQELLMTNILVSSTTARLSSYETKFELSPLARDYLMRNHAVPLEEHREFTKRKRQLVAAGEHLATGQMANPYSAYSIAQRSRSDVIVSKALAEALQDVRARRGNLALESIEKAKSLDPSYSEVYRVEGWVNSEIGHLSTAQLAYETAVELDPRSAPLRLFYGGFLLRILDDPEGALEQFALAGQLDPNSVEIKLETARAKMYLKRWKETAEDVEALLRLKDLAERNQKKAHDLNLQFFHRYAEDLFNRGETLKALGAIEAFKTAYESCPPQLRDAKMRFKIDKILPTIGALKYDFESNQREQELQDRSAEVLKWARETVGPVEGLQLGKRTTGTIGRLPLQQRFGFIDAAGTEVFFHKQALKDQNDWQKLRIGDVVSFMITRTEKGFVGTDVIREASQTGDQANMTDQDLEGEVVRLPGDKRFGFVRAIDGPEYYFNNMI